MYACTYYGTHFFLIHFNIKYERIVWNSMFIVQLG